MEGNGYKINSLKMNKCEVLRQNKDNVAFLVK